MRAVLFAGGLVVAVVGVPLAQAQCTEIWVDQATGVNSSATPGTPTAPFKSITYALAVATNQQWAEPWCVHIRPGVYDADPTKPALEREIFPIELGPGMVFAGTERDTCVLDGQHLTQGNAALLYGEDLAGLEIRDLTLRNMDHSQGSGGAIELRACAGLFDNCRIEDCAAQYGGGAYVEIGAGPFGFADCEFVGNQSDNGGGGLFVEGSMQGGFQSCAFATNAAGGHGGGVRVTGDVIGSVVDCQFDGNTAGNAGGGFQLGGDLQGDLVETDFTANAAGNAGGGFYIGANLAGDIRGSNFDANSASSDGGGFRVTGNLTSGLMQCEFAGNSANGAGGGFRVDGTISGSVADCLFDGNAGHNWRGGGFVAGHLNGDVRECSFTGNTLYKSNGSDERGGGFAVHGTMNGHVTQCDFTGNTVTNRGYTAVQGGGFYVGTLNGYVRDCAFTDNAAVATHSGYADRARGGGFYAGTLAVGCNACTFAGNGADGYGDGCYVGSMGGDLADCAFLNNGSGWAAAFRCGGPFNGDISNCSFTNTRPETEGLIIDGIFDGAIHRCRFTGFPLGAVGLNSDAGTLVTIRDNLFVAPLNTTATHWWGIYTRQSASVANNTLLGPGTQTAVTPAALLFEFNTAAGDSEVLNNVICDAKRGINVEPLLDMLIHHNLFWNVTDVVVRGESGLGNDMFFIELILDNFYENIYEDPMFAGAHPDYHLSASSPCVDTGDPAFVAAPGEADVDRALRVWDGDGDGAALVDRGAHEYNAPYFGDLNCDGVITAGDIDPFVLALIDPAGYESTYPDCERMLADANHDGLITAGDIDPFVDLLVGS